MALTAYEQQTMRLLHDPSNQYYSLSDIDAFINIARRQLAIEGQCIRVLLSGGTVITLTVTNAGNGYVAPTLSFTGSGSQCQATVTQVGGLLQTPTITNGGAGWLTAPTVVITDSAGVNGAITATVDNSASTVANQEVYKFSTLNTLAALTSGVSKVCGIFSIASQWGAGATYKPMLNPMIWSEFQAYRRVWSNQYVNFPANWSTYGQGINGSFYLFPIPSAQMAMDIDTWCIPIDLVDDTTAEAIPVPWTDCVPYYAASLAYDNAQRKDDAKRMYEEFQRFMRRARAFTEAPFVPDYYPGG